MAVYKKYILQESGRADVVLLVESIERPIGRFNGAVVTLFGLNKEEFTLNYSRKQMSDEDHIATVFTGKREYSVIDLNALLEDDLLEHEMIGKNIWIEEFPSYQDASGLIFHPIYKLIGYNPFSDGGYLIDVVPVQPDGRKLISHKIYIDSAVSEFVISREDGLNVQPSSFECSEEIRLLLRAFPPPKLLPADINQRDEIDPVVQDDSGQKMQTLIPSRHQMKDK